MLEKTADRRTLRTRKMLHEALVQLVEEKGLESVTVSDLTTRAEVNRGTFYLHYKDVYDLLEQLQAETLHGLGEIAEHMDFPEIVRCAKEDLPYPGLVLIFEYWARHADFCRTMLGPRGDPSFARRVKDMMKNKIYDKITSSFMQQQQTDLKIPRDFIFAYMTSANIGIIQHWFETGRQQSPRDVALIMTRLVGQGPIAAFGYRPN